MEPIPLISIKSTEYVTIVKISFSALRTFDCRVWSVEDNNYGNATALESKLGSEVYYVITGRGYKDKRIKKVS